MGRACWAVVLALLLCACASTDDTFRKSALPKPSREVVIDTMAKLAQLDNGVRLFVVPDPNARMVEVDVRHRVGSRDEPAGKAGLAHLVEHLMFTIPSGDAQGRPIFNELKQDAFSFNAWTSEDETHYTNYGPPGLLDTFLRHLGWRFDISCEDITGDLFAREREVVRNELMLRGPARRYAGALQDALVPVGHPYHSNAEVDADVLDTLTLEDVCAFASTYYVPARTDVVITGAVDPQQALQTLKAYVGDIPRGNPPPRADVPAFDATKVAKYVSMPGAQVGALIAYPMPRRHENGAMAARVAMERSRLLLGRALRRDERVELWNAFSVGGKEAPAWVVYVEVGSEADIDAVVSKVRETMASPWTSRRDPTFQYDVLRQKERQRVMHGVASIQQSAATYADYLDAPTDVLRFVGDDLAAIDGLTVGAIELSGRTYFASDRAAVIRVRPEKDDPTSRETVVEPLVYTPDRLVRPTPEDEAQANAPFPLDDVALLASVVRERFTLDNGLTVIFVRTTEVPLVRLDLVVGGGTLDSWDAPELAMLAGVGFGLDRESQDAVQAHNILVAGGGQLWTSVDAQTTTYSAQGLSIYFDQLVAAFAEHTVEAVRSSGLVDVWRDVGREARRNRAMKNSSRSNNRVFEAIYGAGHPLVQRAPETGRDFREVSTGGIEAFRRTFFRADNATLIVTGGFDTKLARRYIEAYFDPIRTRRRNTWGTPSAEREARRIPAPKPGKTRIFTRIDDAKLHAQLEQSFGLATTFASDRALLLILVEMLQFELDTIREELGATYGLYATLDDERPRIVVRGPVDGNRMAQVIPAISAAIARVYGGGQYAGRFALARRRVVEQLVADLSDPESLAVAVAAAVRAGQGESTAYALLQRVADARPADLRNAASQILAESRSVAVIEGPPRAVVGYVSARGGPPTEALPDVPTPSR